MTIPFNDEDEYKAMYYCNNKIDEMKQRDETSSCPEASCLCLDCEKRRVNNCQQLITVVATQDEEEFRHQESDQEDDIEIKYSVQVVDNLDREDNNEQEIYVYPMPSELMMMIREDPDNYDQNIRIDSFSRRLLRQLNSYATVFNRLYKLL